MTKYLLKAIIYTVYLIPFVLSAQSDPSFLASLSKLPAEERAHLINQYGQNSGDNSARPKSDSVNLKNIPPDHSIHNLDTENQHSLFDDLLELEKIISEDIVTLEVELADETIDPKSLEDAEDSLKKSKILLRRLKNLQLMELERKAEKLENSAQNKTLKPFGHDLFVGIQPKSLMIDTPVPVEYRVGPGDLIEVQLFGQRNASFTMEISREGIIRFPEIGPINVLEGGTSFVDLKNLLKQKIREQLGDGVQSSINLGAFRTINIFLFGEVENQGTHRVSSMASAVDALLASSGIKETGSMRNIQLNRSGKLIATIDLYDLLLRGDSSPYHSLEPGDVIFVPVINKQVSVDGAVRRPAKYELVGNENLADVIKLAGGLDARAVSNIIHLERLDDNFYSMIKTLSLTRENDFKIRDGDSLKVDSASSSIRNIVTLIGATEKAGKYEWKNDLELQDIITSRLDFSTDIDLQYGLIKRKNDNGKILCISFIPSEILEGQNVPIFPEDVVYFFSKSPREETLKSLISDLRLQTEAGEYAKLVRITGTVHFPGEYPLTESMTVKDLIRVSGGSKDSAYMVDAEITRINIDTDQVASVEHIRIDHETLIEANASSEFKLQPYDILSIKPIPLWREGESVVLEGEFKFPGTYSIKSGETLNDVIQRAGGLTVGAFPQGAIFSRENLRVKEEEQKERLIAQLEADLATATLAATEPREAAQAQSAANSMLARLRNTESQGRLVIDLDKLLNDQANDIKLLVKAGDKLFVPQIPYSVSVSGEVQFPTSHLHNDSLDIDDYLRRSGGFTQNADEGRTFIVKANGAVMTKGGNAWFGKANAGKSINPGDVIVVPIDVKQTRFLENLTYSTQIIYQLAVAAAAVNSF